MKKLEEQTTPRQRRVLSTSSGTALQPFIPFLHIHRPHQADLLRGAAPRRPERLMPPIFLTDYKQDRPLGGAGGEPRQGPSGDSIGNFGLNT